MGALYIHGAGSCLPKNEFTNDFLHKEVGLERGQDWVDSRLGIERRYSILSRDYILKTKNQNPNQAILHARANNETPLTLGIKAAVEAMKRAKVSPQQIGWVIANNDTPFEMIPSAAIQIAKEIGARPGPHCDINAACSSFSLHMKMLADIDPAVLPEFVLCVQTSAYTTRTDYSPKSIDGYIWGDGAAAEVVSARYAGKLRIEPMVFETRASDANAISIDAVGHFSQDGALVREFSIRKTCEMFEEIAQKKNLYAEDCYTIAHQANFVMQNSILAHLKLPVERHLRNVHEQGNIAAAGCPSVIAQNWEKFHKGDQIVYAVVGAGLAWGGGYVEVL
jgi:3-oxoacyl-[acyl-carrier-protein] synthase-3